jgi:hypothetical protein
MGLLPALPGVVGVWQQVVAACVPHYASPVPPKVVIDGPAGDSAVSAAGQYTVHAAVPGALEAASVHPHGACMATK